MSTTRNARQYRKRQAQRQYQRAQKSWHSLLHKDWTKQPIDIWNIICYSLEPEAQMQVRSALRATCQYFNQKLPCPISKKEWISYDRTGLGIQLLKYGASYEYLFKHNIATINNITLFAARANRVDVLKAMRHNIDSDTLVTLVIAGNLRSLRFAQQYASIVEARTYSHMTLLECSANYGHLACLKHLHACGLPLTEKARDNAVYAKNVDCLRYICSADIKPTRTNALTAALHGAFQCLVFIHENGIELDESALEASIQGGIDCFRYVHKVIRRFSDNTCEMTAKHKKLDCLQYAHENGATWDSKVCHTAARKGFIEGLKYAHENGCPLDINNPSLTRVNTCQSAAVGGSVKCLEYCYSNGIPLNQFVLQSAIMHGNHECVNYVKAHWNGY